ncbi:hypothetical protein FB567DRAFT_525198 [Paraphoma chrysanthemicola]|uniref:BTB domain-containing protein n=1 Tax=Paraphoma chrysanthemicola TaxID=798071 RepID=A0A8K0R7U2_9PLEO|nr:hypothetical protein FB567DRAFT_525198 [Paraphoma chrysanthemicola]
MKRERTPSPDIPHKRELPSMSSNSSLSDSIKASSDLESRVLRASTGPGSIVSTSSSQMSDSNSSDRTLSLAPQHQALQSAIAIMAAPKDGSSITTHAFKSESGLSTPPISLVIPEDSTSGSHDHKPLSVTTCPPPECYPAFHTGNVIIYCNLTTPPRKWQLHSAILARHSSWFREVMHLSPEAGTSFHGWLFFLLEQHDGNIKLVLQRSRPLSDLEVKDHILEVLGIKIEELSDNTSPGTYPTPPASVEPLADSPINTSPNTAHTEAVDNWDQVLASFYAIPPRLPAIDISTTLSTSESLLNIAASLDCVSLLSAPISTALQSHRHALYTHISRDPARYLLLSLILKNSAIYTESLIHIIGAHPCWPWPTKRSVIPDRIQNLVAKKAAELETLCTQTERDLLTLTIKVSKGAVRPDVPSHFDTWFTVQVFRDTLAKQFNALDTDRKKSLKRGTLFRKIRKGGAEYMPYEEVRRLMENVMPSAVEGLEEDLRLLKDYAKGFVEEVCVDEGMAGTDGEGNGEGVGWLTCIKIGNEDIPWLDEWRE